MDNDRYSSGISHKVKNPSCDNDLGSLIIETSLFEG